MKKYLSSTLIACILCFIIGFGTACSCSDVEIKEIYFNSTTIDLVVGDIIECDAEKLGLVVLPKNATNQDVNFIVTKEDRTSNGVKIKVLDDSQKPKIVAVNPGVATITARTTDGQSMATLNVRVFPKNYELSAPSGLTFDNVNQRVVWDEKAYLIDDRYPNDDTHQLSEVFYQVELNGEVKEVTKDNYFENFEASQSNNVRVKTIALPERDYIKASGYTGTVNFQVLPAPTNLQLTQTGLVWDAVVGANTYSVIVYKRIDAITLERYEEFKNITETTYNLDLEEAGDFVVEVKAVPAENNSNIYTSKASNKVSVKKYSEVQNITIEDDKLVWNAVAGAEEYNIILINKETNEQSKINVRDSSALENVKYDLASLNIAGKFIAKIETISNYSLGLNSKISTVHREFIKLACPTPDKIEDNKLIFKEVDGIEDVPVLVKIGDVALTDADTTFTLPEDSLAGTYNLYFKALGDGSNVVSSVWTTSAYEVTKLPAPTSITHDGYKVSVNNVPGSKGVAFIDVYDEYEITSNVKSELISKDDDAYKYWISVTDKVNKYSLINQNKYTIKAKAIGDNAFDSNYSEQSFSFYKLLPMTQAVASAISTGGINFKYKGLHASKNGGEDFTFIGYYEDVGIDGAIEVGEILSGESVSVIEPLVKVDGENYYFDVCVRVYRIVGEELEELYMTILSYNSTQLMIDELNDAIKGGELIFKMSFYGNNDTVLGGDERLCGQENGNQAFSMRKAYEPINIVVSNSNLKWEVLESEDTDLFVIYDKDNNEIYKGHDSITELVRTSISEYGVLSNFSILNSNENKDQSIYWRGSKKVEFSAGVLNAPTIAFNGDYVEWSPVENATEYIVYFNDEEQIVSIDDLQDDKLKINYKEILAQKGGEFIVKVVASMGADCEDLWFDSIASNTLTVRNVFVKYVDIKEGKIFAKPNLDFDVTLSVKLLNEEDEVIYSGNAVYDATATITDDDIVGAYVFNIAKHLTTSGYYHIALQFVYSGAQSDQVKFINFDEVTIKNVVSIPQQISLNFNEDANGYPYVSWANVTSATGFTLLVKDVTTDEVVEVIIPDTENTSYNLSLIEGLKSSSYYVIALIANGDGDQKTLNFVTENDSNTIVVDKAKAYVLPTSAKYLDKYNSNSEYFYIAGQVQNFDSSISGYEVTLTWTKEEGINYEIYVDGALVTTQSDNLYKYTIDTTSQTQVKFKLKAKSTTNTLMYRSAFSKEITVLLLPAVSNLSAHGFITFDYDIENTQFKIDIVDETTSLPVNSLTTESKQINFSTLGLDYNKTYTVSVTALGDAKTTIQSVAQTVRNLTVASALTLSVDSSNGVFITNNTMPYITFFAQKFEEGTYTDEYSYGIYASSSNPVWDISATVPAGKYKVWASATNTNNGANELYGIASNYLYIEVLPTPTGICLRNDCITFTPVEGQTTYIIQITDSTNTVTQNTVVITDTTTDYNYVTNLLDVAGVYTIKILTKGNYNTCTDDSFASTANSPISSDLIVTRLATPSNAQIQNGVLTFTGVAQAEKYKIVFSCVGEEDVVKETIQTSLNLSEVEFIAGTYSCTIQAIGNNERNILSSVEYALSSNIVISTNEDVVLNINATTRKLEWNTVSAEYGYVVKFYNTTTTQVSEFEATENSFAIPTSLIAGTYNVTVYAKGNGTNILNGKESNVLSIQKLAKVQNLRKVQSDAQNTQNKASIDFDIIDGVSVYLIKVTNPNGSINSVEFERNSASDLFEYTFENPGQYIISVTAIGNYIQTVNSNEQILTLQKLNNPQDLTFTYRTNITEQNEVQILATVAWTAQSNASVRYKILFNVFGVQTDTVDITENVEQSTYTATFNINTINKLTNTIKLRFDIALNNQQYLSSDWVELEVYVYNPITITNVQDNKMVFTYHADDADKLDYVNSLIVFVKDAETEQMVKAVKCDVINVGEVDISALLNSLPSGNYLIGAYVVGNGAMYLSSNESALKPFTKLQVPSVSLSKAITDNSTYYSTYITWDAVQNATRYEIKINDVFVEYTTSLYYDLANTINAFDIEETMFNVSVSALGGADYAQSNTSSFTLKTTSTMAMINSILQEDGTTKLEQKIYLQDGSFVIESDLLQDYYVMAKFVSGVTTVEVLVQTEIFNIPSDIAGGATVTAYFRVVPKNFVSSVVDAGNGVDTITFFTVSSKYLQCKPRNVNGSIQDFYKLNVAVTGFANGRLKVRIPEYKNLQGSAEEGLPSVYLQVLWGSVDYLYSFTYSENAEREIQAPSSLIPYNEMVVKYRFLGDNYNVSADFNYFNINAERFSVVDIVVPSTVDGLIKWNAVNKASGYELRIVHNTANNDCSVYSNAGFCFYTKILDKSVTQYDIESLITELKENSNYKSILGVNNESSPYYQELILDGEPFTMRVSIYALGDENLATNSVTYLTSDASVVEVYQLFTPSIKCVDGKITGIQGYVVDGYVEVMIDGVSHIISGDVNSLFTEAKQYSNVKFRMYANKSIDPRPRVAAAYQISGEWTDEYTLYKIPATSLIGLNAEGFLQLNSVFENYNNLGFSTMQEFGAYKKIFVQYTDGTEMIEEIEFSCDSNTVSASMYLGDYLLGYLDFLEENISSIKISIVGGTYSEEYTGNAFLLTSEFSNLTPISKLNTPKNYKIQNSTLSWDEVENASKYVLIINDGNTDKCIEVYGTSYSVLRNNEFPAGSYSVKVRAIGNNNYLCSNATEQIQFKVLETPTITIEDGYIVVQYQDSSTRKVYAYGIDNESKEFEQQYTVASDVKNKIELPENITNVNILTYTMKFYLIGDGSQIIDSFFTTDIEVKRLQQISVDLSTEQGKLMWSPVTFEGTTDKVTNYIVKVVDSTQQVREFSISVDDSNFNGVYYSADIPPSMDLYGLVNVSVKPQGLHYAGDDYINGPYSEALQAFKYNPTITINVSDSSGSLGCLSWSTTEGSSIANFRCVLYQDVQNDLYLEHTDVITNYFYDIPSTLNSTNNINYQLSSGKYIVGIKMVGQYYNNVHYLSTFSKSIEVNRLDKPTNFGIVNGVLRWNKVQNAKFYELVFNYEDEDPNIGITEIAKITIAENSSSLPYREYAMTESSLIKGKYSSITVRAIGGSKVVNKQTTYYINSSTQIKQNVYKLDRPVITNLTLDEVNNDGVYINFKPITYVENGTTYVVKNYQLMLKKGGFNTTTVFTENDITPETELISKKFNTSALTDGVYELYIMALAPSEDNAEDNHIINSVYSDKVYVTKPGNISNLRFENMCYTWTAPTGLSASEVTYDIHYIVQDEFGVYGSVQKMTISTAKFYPPKLGTYKIVVVASVQGCLKSDYVGRIAYLSNQNKCNTLEEFISTWGVEGSNLGMFAGGEGTLSKPYEIMTVTNFANMKYYSNTGFYFKLMNNLEDASFDALIGLADDLQFASASNPFKANFNGNNKTIYIRDLLDTGTEYNGLFGYVDGGQISNLNVVVNNTVYDISARSNLKFGTLVGYANNANILKVKASANIELQYNGITENVSIYVGGIVGQAERNTIIDQCKFNGSIGYGDISSVMANVPYVTSYVGGIVGNFENGTSSESVRGCVNHATIQGTIIGGIVGRLTATVSKCINLGTLNAIESRSSSPVVGGLVGSVTLSTSSIKITKSYCKGDINVYVLDKTTPSIGGLVGRTNYYQNASGFKLTLEDSFTTSSFTTNSDSIGNSVYAILGNANMVSIELIRAYYLYTSTVVPPVSANTSTIINAGSYKESLSTAVANPNGKFTLNLYKSKGSGSSATLVFNSSDDPTETF